MTVSNIENAPGLKMKTSSEEWANAETCVICKQPFNPQRSINRHHWYFLVNVSVVFVADLFAENAQEKE